MKYDDFPLLNDHEYSLINEHFLTQQQFDRKTQNYKICQELTSCLNNCWLIENLYNTKISQAIKQVNQVLNKQLNNFASLFNIQVNKVQSISNFSLFSFIKKINKIISILSNWLINEQKEYYKTIAKKSIDELLTTLDNVFSALEESNIHFFKHM